jgi:glucose-1-phosphate thymidylyltransferase
VRGVLLAGGSGTRLRALSGGGNKHLLPVGGVPMILHPLRRLVGAGVDRILVVTGSEHVGDLAQALGSGAAHACELTYRVQERPGGIAQALGLAEDFAAGGPVVAVLADNVFDADLGPIVAGFVAAGAQGARVLCHEVPDPERYGVAEIEDGRIVRLREKPADPPSRLAVVGIYLYDARFGAFVRRLAPSPRGELEITDLNAAYLAEGTLSWAMLPGFWTDAGTPESFARADAWASGA